MFLIVLGVTIFLVWFYILFGREWLIALWPERFTTWHQIEDTLWSNSKTLLATRLTWLGSAVLGFHEWLAASGFDVTPITTEITNLIPDDYKKYVPLIFALGLAIIGYAFEWLRKQTTEPLSAKLPAEPEATA